MQRRLKPVTPFPLLIAAVSGCSPLHSTSTAPAFARDCGEPIVGGANAIVTVAHTTYEPGITWSEAIGTSPVVAGGVYAVVDDVGLVGELQATDPNHRCSVLLVEGACRGYAEWNARWVVAPTRSWGARDPLHGLLAFGPVHARYQAAERVVPPLPTELDENGTPTPRAPHVTDGTWTRLNLVSLATERSPSAIEVWGRRCGGDTASVRELRLVEDGRTRVIQRSVRVDPPESSSRSLD